jgi:phage terminase large subunit-like protein
MSGLTFLFSDEVITRNNGYVDLEELKKHECVGGYYLSYTESFTSACLEFPLSDGRVFVLSHSWVPQAKVEKDNEKIPFREWEKEGYLTICPGDYVRDEYVYDWFVDMSKKFTITKITHDPYTFRLAEKLSAYGFKTVRVLQGVEALSAPLKHIKELFLDGKVVFNKNELFRWYMNNVRLVEDRDDNWIPTKQSKYREISGFFAFLNAHTEVMKSMPPLKGDYYRYLKSKDTKEYKPFLVIQLDSLDSVPYVFLEGEEITGRVKVEFQWETRKSEQVQKVPFINIEYVSEDIKSNGLLGTKTIRYGVAADE